MSEVKNYEPGTPSWVDLATTDAEASRQFYGELMGWSFDVGGSETGGYAMAKVRDLNVAGQMEINADMRAQGVPPSWTTYISVSDAERVAEQVKSAGGQVMMGPMDVMEYGRMAIAQDPTGAVFGLWQPGTHIGAQLVNEPGGVVWNHLATPDPSAAGAFYEALGWSLEQMDMGGTPQTMFKVGDRTVAGMGDIKDYPPGTPPHWDTFFAVSDCDAVATRVPELGGTVLVPPTDMPFGRFAAIQDPQGAVFSVVKMPEDSQSS
ncbi:MAG: VOC family protein [Mycobacteriales bacterium]